MAILDRGFLSSLDERQLANGAAEIAKMAIVKNAELMCLLETCGTEFVHEYVRCIR